MPELSSGIGKLHIGGHGLVAHQLPELVLLAFKFGKVGAALSQRHGDVDDLAYPAGPP